MHHAKVLGPSQSNIVVQALFALALLSRCHEEYHQWIFPTEEARILLEKLSHVGVYIYHKNNTNVNRVTNILPA